MSEQIVVGVDGSEAAEKALIWAAETASRNGAHLVIAHGDSARPAEALPGTGVDYHHQLLREAIRELLYENNGQGRPGDRWDALNRAADEAMLTVDFGTRALVATAAGLDGILGRVAVTCLGAMGDGTWERLKCCRNVACRWSFYDYSRNRSASWCSMQICGNRTKTRAYRRRAVRQ